MNKHREFFLTPRVPGQETDVEVQVTTSLVGHESLTQFLLPEERTLVEEALSEAADKIFKLAQRGYERRVQHYARPE